MIANIPSDKERRAHLRVEASWEVEFRGKEEEMKSWIFLSINLFNEM